MLVGGHVVSLLQNPRIVEGLVCAAAQRQGQDQAGNAEYDELHALIVYVNTGCREDKGRVVLGAVRKMNEDLKSQGFERLFNPASVRSFVMDGC